MNTTLSFYNLFTPEYHQNEHNLIQINKPKKKVDTADCTFCSSKLQRTQNPKIIELSCRHVYHLKCYNYFLQKSSDSQAFLCPSCKTIIDHEDTIQHRDFKTFKGGVFLECIEDSCKAFGTEKEIKKNMPICPYPFTSAFNKNPKKFLEKNYQEIQSLLINKFKEFSPADQFFIYNKNNLKVDISSKYYQKPAFWIGYTNILEHVDIFWKFYSAVDINKGQDGHECFSILMYSIRADLMMLSLRNNYPSMFNTHTSVYVYSDNFLDDSIKFKINGENIEISFRQVFDLVNKQFNWDKLKELIGESDYMQLFSNISIKRRGLKRSYTYISGDSACILTIDENNMQNKTDIIPSGIVSLATDTI
jgi:hypothetical protein